MEEQVPLWKKGKHLPQPPPSAVCPACHLITTDRHCTSPTCDWFLCRQHRMVIGIIGPERTFWLAKPSQG